MSFLGMGSGSGGLFDGFHLTRETLMASAPDQFTSNSEISFMILCTMLVQLMTPGLAFFYAGLCKPSGVCTMMAKSTVSIGVITCMWFLFVFGMSFGPVWSALGGWVGDPWSCVAFSCMSEYKPLLLPGSKTEYYGVPNLPGWLFALYQNKFAVITPALASGAIADRITIGPWIAFIAVWIVIVYAPWCHSIWGGGYYAQQGVVDFAGGIVVHSTSGWSALAIAKALGNRNHIDATPHSVPLVLLGTALLWFGWFGFNGGSAYSPNGVAITACVNSHLAACSAMLGWAVLHYWDTGKFGLLPLCVGSIAGLATITPAAGYVQPIEAVWIGLLASGVCFGCIHVANGLGVDDALDVWAVHGVGGGLGTILLGLMADPEACLDKATAPGYCVNPGTTAGTDIQFRKQVEATAVCAIYSAAVSYALICIIKKIWDVYPRHYDQDYHELGEQAYGFAATPTEPLLGGPNVAPAAGGFWEQKNDGSKSWTNAPGVAEFGIMTPEAPIAATAAQTYQPPAAFSSSPFTGGCAGAANGAVDARLGGLPQNGSIMVEYVWLGGDETTGGFDIRSKSRTLDRRPTSVSQLPVWNFDGSSTNQAPGDNSEVLLKPAAMWPDPFRGGQNIVVLCECMDPRMNPIATNTRNHCARVMAAAMAHEPWFGIEQEYTLFEKDGVTPLGWPVGGEPKPQGPYYCSAGYDVSYGRNVMETHYRVCLAAGIKISGTNAEVMPGQWEYQVGPCVGISSGDEMWISRYFLIRVCELLEVNVSFDPKPIPGDWNGAGCHTNVSTKSMRKPGGYKDIIKAIEKLGPKHMEHIQVYGEGNNRRLTGRHETASMDNFSYGVANRGASVRIPRSAEADGCGYFEDRRPASNMDPYLVTGKIVQTCLLE
eukprot:TRINITY_DN7970_c0_g2_i1.p1 TRINITY_DN7970_c0_g2~~TRINITY_DN7970_c0_g2_i1.p1  ORF type:complete len:883 (-),score=189.94 TRINITY_DN7970_c0_g2_i1:200-2848(-)